MTEIDAVELGPYFVRIRHQAPELVRWIAPTTGKRRGRTHHYSVNPAKDALTTALGWMWRDTPLDGPLAVALLAEVPARSRDKGDTWLDAKPDHDNVMKGVCDALERAGVLVNDSRIALSRCAMVRRVALRGHGARMTVWIGRAPDVATLDADGWAVGAL